MSSRSINRKDFLVLTVSSVAASALAAACGGDDPATSTGTAGASGSGTAGTGGSAAGTNGTGGSASGSPGTSGSPGSSGSGTGGTAGSGTSGSGGLSGGGSGGAAGSGGSGGAANTGGGGGVGKCGADIAVTSSGSGHTHTLLVTAAQIAAGTDLTILSGRASNDAASGHQHYVKITVADFTMLKAGMEVKKKSCNGGEHFYVLKCGGGGTTPGVPTEADCPAADTCGDDKDMGKACL